MQGVSCVAYSPLGGQGPPAFPTNELLTHPTVLAVAKEAGRSPAQVRLRETKYAPDVISVEFIILTHLLTSCLMCSYECVLHHLVMGSSLTLAACDLQESIVTPPACMASCQQPMCRSA